MFASGANGAKKPANRAALPVCLISLLFGLQVATCEPSQQQQQRAGALSNELSQDSFGLVAPEALAAFGPYARGSYVNSKRARKMSAFMPMRGRKDGRDETLLRHRQLEPAQAEVVSLERLARELEPAAELSVLRLLGGQRGAGSGSKTNAGAGSLFQSMPVGLVERVESKYRRAFHPMRGKKWDPQVLASGDSEPESEPEGAQLAGSLMQDVGEPFESV